MQLKIPVLIVILIQVIACTADRHVTFFASKWQSMNDPGLVIEFTPKGEFLLFRDGSDFTSTLPEAPYNYSITRSKQDWFAFTTADQAGVSTPYKGKIEVIAEDRIRVYFTKHHEILDLADEFYRTNDLTSFHEIMQQFTAGGLNE